ncbi:hypothetical protein RHS01_09759 [Rhizoctonia solani]|uniref:Uncharacterized protein n=1 Tax=Rhizoctonia solani TaxID=456999 RepID=A0A8H7M350_9AGAM|nr:hypothetical protein RHS01_09759 [Rhizoctonia solani]
MPLTPVAHSVLYLFKAAAMNNEDYYNVEIDVVGNSDPQLDSSKELGLTMPKSSIASITRNCQKALGLHECQAAERFLQYFWDTWKADYVRKIPIRKTIKSTTQGKKGGLDPYGYAAYHNLVLAAINRKGSVMNQVEETLGKIGATPANLWKDDRSLNRQECPATKRVLEHQVPIADTHARLEEQDVQAALCSKAQIPKALRTTRALTDWQKIAIGTKEVDELHFLSRERMLKQLWSSLGFGSLEDDLTASKSKSKSTQDGPSKEEMQAAYAYYVESTAMELAVLTKVLWAQLGLPGVDQFPFAEPGTGESAKDMAPLAKTCAVPFWHQVVGTLRILEGAFTQRVGNCAQPTLLCNNVGLVLYTTVRLS